MNTGGTVNDGTYGDAYGGGGAGVGQNQSWSWGFTIAVVFFVILIVVGLVLIGLWGTGKLTSSSSSSSSSSTAVVPVTIVPTTTYIYCVIQTNTGNRDVWYRSIVSNDTNWSYITTNGGIKNIVNFSSGGLYYIPDYTANIPTAFTCNVCTNSNCTGTQLPNNVLCLLTSDISYNKHPTSLYNTGGSTYTSDKVIMMVTGSLSGTIGQITNNSPIMRSNLINNIVSVTPCRFQNGITYIVLTQNGLNNNGNVFKTSNTISGPYTFSGDSSTINGLYAIDGFAQIPIVTMGGATTMFSRMVEYFITSTATFAGFIVISSTDNFMYILDGWNSSPRVDTATYNGNRLALTDICVLPDLKTIIGVGTDHTLYTRANLSSNWTILDTNVNVTTILSISA